VSAILLYLLFTVLAGIGGGLIIHLGLGLYVLYLLFLFFVAGRILTETCMTLWEM
jgi:hypothetical protein